jgi:hypothetical protein
MVAYMTVSTVLPIYSRIIESGGARDTPSVGPRILTASENTISVTVFPAFIYRRSECVSIHDRAFYCIRLNYCKHIHTVEGRFTVSDLIR